MTVTLPLRIPTSVSAGLVHAAKEPNARHPRTARAGPPRPSGQGGRTRKNPRRPAAWRRRVHVVSRTASSPEQVLAVLQTDQRGSFTYLTRASATTTLRLVYDGSGTTLPSQREITLFVPASSTIRARPHRVMNGQVATFVGRLQSLPTPIGGKLMELQVVLSGRWQTFRTVRTSRAGVWRVRYRFRRSCGLLHYRFRARLPAESGYPFESGHTRAVGVRVRGAPCR